MGILDRKAQRQVISQTVCSLHHRFTDILETRSEAIRDMSKQKGQQRDMAVRLSQDLGGSVAINAFSGSV